MNLLQDFAGFAEEWLRDFTGREWLVQQVREFLDNPQSPHFLLLVGEPGIGKSAFAAYLWQRAHIPDAVHFCIGGRGGTMEPLSFIQSTAEQLTERLPGFGEALVETQKAFADRNVNIAITQNILSMQGGQATGVSIQYLEVQGLPPETAFDRLIRRPLRVLKEENLPPTVLLVDALDEAVAHISHPNIVEILIQAQDLPTQVRFVLTSRPDPNVLSHFADRPHIVIEAQSPENQEDVARYLRTRLHTDEGLQGALAEVGWNETQFVDGLGERSEWNFLYLSLALPEIAAGHLRLGEDVLPGGLDGYYRYLLNTRLGLERWTEWGADLMEVTLALQEPASLEQLAAYLGWSTRQTLQRLGQMSQLLDPALQRQEQYWPYHWSIVNFLRDRERARELWCDEQQGHARIADFYLSQWGGVDTELPKLQIVQEPGPKTIYGLQYLARHLYQSGQYDALYTLIENRQWYEVKLGFDLSGRGFGMDIDGAIRAAETQGKEGLPRVAAYCLQRARLRERAGQVTPALVETLAYLGQEDTALGYALLAPEPKMRARLLCAVAGALRSRQQESKAKGALHQALDLLPLARGEDERNWRVPNRMREVESQETLSGILMQIIDTMGELRDVTGLQYTLRVVGGLEFRGAYYTPKVDLLVAIAQNLTKAGDSQSALEVAEQVAQLPQLKSREDERIQNRVRALVLIAEELAASGAREEARQVLGLVLPALGGRNSALIISELARIAIRNRDFEDARRLIDQIGPTYPREQAFAWLAEGLLTTHQENALQQVLEIASNLTLPEFKTKALLTAIDAKSLVGNAEDIYELLDVAGELDDESPEWNRSKFLSWLVHHLVKKGAWERAQAVIGQIEDYYAKGCALVEIAKVAQKGSMIDLAIHSLESAMNLLPNQISESSLLDYREIALHCFIASAWAPIDRERGLAVIPIQELPVSLFSPGEFDASVPCDLISRAFADLGAFDEAQEYAELDRSNKANTLVYVGRRLIEAEDNTRAMTVLLHAADIAAQQATGQWYFDRTSLVYVFPSQADRAVWAYADAVRLLLELGGPQRFTQCLELAEGVHDVGSGIRLLANLEYVVRELHWDEEASIVRAIIETMLRDAIPSSDVLTRRMKELGHEKLRHDDPLFISQFWINLLGNWPTRWIVHRYTEFDDEEIADRLRRIEQLIRQWLSREELSIRRHSTDEELDLHRLSANEQNRVANVLAGCFARFRQYDDALRVVGLARMMDYDVDLHPSLDFITLARLALLSYRLDDPLTCRDCLLYILGYALRIPRIMLFGQESEAFIYAADAAMHLGDQTLIDGLRSSLKGLLQHWSQDEQQQYLLSEPNAGAMQYMAPALATLGDTEGLRLALEFARQIVWGDDQADTVAAIAKAMAAAKDREGLGLVFDVAQDFAPEKPQSWIEQWSKIVSALLDAHFQMGNSQQVADIAQWLMAFEAKKDFHSPEHVESRGDLWIAGLLAYASRLLTEVEPERYEWLVEQAVGIVTDLEAWGAQEEGSIWMNKGRERIVSAYLDLARACANMQRGDQAGKMLRRACMLSEQREHPRSWPLAPLELYALRDLIGILTDCSELEEAVSLIPDFTDGQLQFSAIYQILTRLANEGNFLQADELLAKYPNDSELWQPYWRLYCAIAKANLHGKVTADWTHEFLRECAAIDDLSTKTELCVLAASAALSQDDTQSAKQLVEHVLCSVEQSDPLGSEELRALVPLVELIVRLNDVRLLHRVVSLAIADNYHALTEPSGDRRQAVSQLTRLLMEQLVQAMVNLQDLEGLDQILNTVGDIGLEEAREYYPLRSYHHRLHPLMHTQLYMIAQHMEGVFDVAMRFRYEVIVLLAKAFGKLGHIADLHQLSRIPVRVSLSDEFILEVGAYGSIARELFRLQGEKAISDILEAGEDVPEVWQPVLFSNLAWAVHTTDAGAPICSELIEKATSAIDAATEFMERESSEPGLFGPACVDRGSVWAAMSNSIAVVGAMAALTGGSVQYEDLFDKAIEIAKKIRKNDQREEALEFVVHTMARCSFFSRGLDLAVSIIDKGIRNSALADLAEAQARMGQILEAIETATLHSDPGDDLVFEIGASLAECTIISVSNKVDAMCQSFRTLGTRDADNFWQCFRAMLPVIEQIGGVTLLVDTWERMQQVGNLLLQEAEPL